MSQEILGYKENHDPIHPIKPGMITTACCISCAVCGAGIRGMGGPMRNARCPDCYQFDILLSAGNMNTLTGGEAATGVQCVYTVHDEEQETFDMCSKDDANHVSVYLRLPIGEVVPLMDFVIEPDVDALKWAKLLVKNLKHYHGLNLEPGGALE